MKNNIRKCVYIVEIYTGEIIGILIKHIPIVRDLITDIAIWLGKILPDKVSLIYEKFADSLAGSIYGMRLHRVVKRRVTTNNFLEVDLFEKTQRLIYTHKVYEMGDTRFLRSILRKCDYFIDVGANVGYFTMLAASIMKPESHIHSFEPQEDNFNILKNNINKNNINNVILHNLGLGNYERKAILNINPLNYGGSSIVPFKKYKTGNKIYDRNEIEKQYSKDGLFQEVYMKRLDSVIQVTSQSIACLKIDVEGYELEVLRGSKSILKSGSIKYIVCEMNRLDIQNKIIGYLRKFNYKPFKTDFKGKLKDINFHEKLHGNVVFMLNSTR